MSSRDVARVRVGDAERSRATSVLAEHYAQGRLDDEELDRRTSRALVAVYADDLDALFVDLPGARQRDQPTGAAVAASRPRRPPPAPPRPPVFPLVLLIGLALVVLTRGAALWFLLPLLWMGRQPGFSGRYR